MRLSSVVYCGIGNTATCRRCCGHKVGGLFFQAIMKRNRLGVWVGRDVRAFFPLPALTGLMLLEVSVRRHQIWNRACAAPSKSNRQKRNDSQRSSHLQMSFGTHAAQKAPRH
jgi:hypothetical protein